jgi:hypothetical protein
MFAIGGAIERALRALGSPWGEGRFGSDLDDLCSALSPSEKTPYVVD